MHIIESIIINIIVMIFPILIYVFYVAYKKNLKEKQNELFLEFALFSSLFLSIHLFNILEKNGCIILITIPILLSYLYKKRDMAIIMSVILFEFLKEVTNLPSYILIITPVLYFLFHIFVRLKNKSNKFFTNGFYLITMSNTLIYLFLNIKKLDLKIIIEIITIMMLFYFVVLLINFMICKANEILNLYMSLKNFEEEKQIKLSLFKIAHEIKNPIAVVKGYIDMFDVNDKNKSIKYINIISGEINRTLNLLNDLMQFSKITLEKELIDFNLLLDDVKQIVINIFEAKKVNYKFKSEENIFIYADYNRLKQVIINLIKNSIESCNKNGLVKITTYKDNDKLYMIIKDNGSGMDKETLEKIQTPFYTTKENGTGLGVSLSKEIIEAHKGKIIYTSTKGKETIVKIAFPLK